MTTLLSKEHPYWDVRGIVSRNIDSVLAVNLSFYEYTPQALEDARFVFSVPSSDFVNYSYMQGVIERCPAGCELAVHSKLKMVDGTDKHIPMVDMSTGSAAQLDKLKPVLKEEFSKFVWYRSGRSYHGYGTVLIDNDSWIVLMGKLLLANRIGVPPTVDPRWVGHRLIAGYAALRWTKNTAYYTDVPRKLVSERGPLLGL